MGDWTVAFVLAALATAAWVWVVGPRRRRVATVEAYVDLEAAAPKFVTAMPVRSRPSRPLVTAAAEGAAGDAWQGKARRFLRPDVGFAEKRELAQALIGEAPTVATAVRDAVSQQSVEPLLDGDPEGRRIYTGLQAVSRQLRDDVLPETRERVRSAKEEFSNVFDAVPTNLEGPSYSSLRQSVDWAGGDGFAGYEVRRYDAFVTATLDMAADDNGTGFNRLAGYISGRNTGNTKVAMTTPVIMGYGTDGANSMAFPLPAAAAESAASAPVPKDRDVQVADQPSRVLAVRRFPGLATDGEVKRQVQALRDELMFDQLLQAEDPGAADHVLLQYNPPYTLPFLRRNEVAVELAWVEDEDRTAAEQEFYGDNVETPSDCEGC